MTSLPSLSVATFSEYILTFLPNQLGSGFGRVEAVDVGPDGDAVVEVDDGADVGGLEAGRGLVDDGEDVDLAVGAELDFLEAVGGAALAAGDAVAEELGAALGALDAPEVGVLGGVVVGYPDEVKKGFVLLLSRGFGGHRRTSLGGVIASWFVSRP